MAKERGHLPGTNTRFLKQLEQASELADLNSGPSELRAFVPGTPTAEAVMYIYVAAEYVKIPASGKHQIYADQPPADDWVAAISGGSGSIIAAVASGQSKGAFDFPMGDVYLSPGDAIAFVAPATADTSIANIALTLQIEPADPSEMPGPIVAGGDFGTIDAV